MIRRMLLASAGVLALTLAAPLQAQSVYLSAGLSSPSGDDMEDVNTGWMIAGGALFSVGESGLWAGLDGSFGQNNIDEAVATDESIKPWSIMGVLGFSPETAGNVDPFFWAGAGIMGASVSDSDIEIDSGFGWQAGAGVAFGAAESNVRPYVEVRYHSASLDSTDGIDTAEVDLRLFGFLVGATIDVGN